MSPLSSAASDSRSSSPPPTPETFDFLDTALIQTDFGLTNSAYLSTHQNIMEQAQMELSMNQNNDGQKMEDETMLRLDELLEQHAYDDSIIPSYHAFTGLSNNMDSLPSTSQSPNSTTDAGMTDLTRSSVVIPPAGSMSGTKPIPPPASVPKKQDPSLTARRVVCPPKESCYNLPIMVPSIPEGGTKSRVETQVRVTVDLADASSSSDPSKYNCVGSWKWLKLPPGTATKRRTRKQGKIDPDPQDILHLSVTVTCATPPHNRVLSCSSCQAREAKRVAKKIAARVRPARSDSESNNDDPSSTKPKHKQIEDTTSIIQFNCPEVLDFNAGSVVLPLRITCYCRHHREKVGFNVHFTMLDHAGRIIGTGSSRPIMITDDHKTAPAARHTDFANGLAAMNAAWQQSGGMMTDFPVVENRAPSKRKKEASTASKRPKPYDSSNKPVRSPPREGSVSSAPSPSSTFASLPMTRSPTPITLFPGFNAEPPTMQPTPGLLPSSQISDSSTSDALVTPLDQSPRIPVPKVPIPQEIVHTPSPPMNPSAVVMPAHPHPIPFMFFDPQATAALQVPMIHRLIPAMGPTHGGIEVTILGANFHASLQLNCIFGDVQASSTQRWSDNTLVCILPPRATAGVVAVWFDGFPQTDQVTTPTSLFTYADESDRALMELALQVVGLKMTGKIEDAKNVAMRIVGGSGDNSNNHSGNNSNAMQLAASLSSTRDLLPLLLARRAGDNDDFESLIVDFLAVLDAPLDLPNAISTAKACLHATPGGQTLLHLGAFLGFSSLLSFLIKQGVDLDARDKNGYTPLHFAALSQSEEAARVLVAAGADTEIVNALGKTPAECAPGMADILSQGMTRRVESDSDEEAGWGDAEEEEDDDETPVPHRNLRRRNVRRKGPKAGLSEKQLLAEAETSENSDTLDNLLQGKDKKGDTKGADEKQAASFLEMLQRKFAVQIPGQGIIHHMPQLPLPNLPPMPALPQLPMVFPVYVPMMPGLPAFLGGEHGSNGSNKPDGSEGADVAVRPEPITARAVLEWRAAWERLVGLAMAAPRGDEAPPPMYTPREGGNEQPADEKAEAPESQPQETQETQEPVSGQRPSDIRPIGYDSTPVPEQEVNAYDYKPSAKRQQKLQKKHDKMLLIFWLPILLLSLLWAIYSGVQFAFQTVRTFFPKTAVV